MKGKKIGGIGMRKPKISLEKALSREYKVRVIVRKKDATFWGVISLPQILVGKIVKLVLVEKKRRCWNDN